MRILVTRPQPDCKTTADRLRGFGHIVDEVPLLIFEATPPAHLDLSNVAVLAFTSRRAVAVMAAHAQLSNLVQFPVFTVGETTATACREAGFSRTHSANGDVAALAQLIADHRKEFGNGAILYPAAKDRAGDLGDLLAQQKLPCRTLPVYEMAAAQEISAEIVQAISAGEYDRVLIFSKRTAETLVALLKKSNLHHIFSSMPVYAISKQAAEPFKDFARIYISDAPREDELLDLALADC
ncbi:MAG: uroporphyrinogen-III synthase [Roseibium sp.]